MIKVLLGVFLCSKCTTDRRIGRNNVTSDSSQASIIVLKVPVWSVRAHRASLQHAKNHIISPPGHLAAEGLTQRAARRFRKPEERTSIHEKHSNIQALQVPLLLQVVLRLLFLFLLLVLSPPIFITAAPRVFRGLVLWESSKQNRQTKEPRDSFRHPLMSMC